MFKNNNNNTKVRCEIYPVLALKTPERCQWCGSDVFIVNYEHISYLLLMFLLSNWACKFQEEKEACIGPYQTSMVVFFSNIVKTDDCFRKIALLQMFYRISVTHLQH